MRNEISIPATTFHNLKMIGFNKFYCELLCSSMSSFTMELNSTANVLANDVTSPAVLYAINFVAIWMLFRILRASMHREIIEGKKQDVGMCRGGSQPNTKVH